MNAPQGYWRYSWRSDAPPQGPGDLVVVPIDRPAQSSILHPSHSIERIELIGDHAVAFGLAHRLDLGVSTIELGQEPRIADSRILLEMMESEGRSHAFNALINDDGSGVFGLPTVYRSNVAGRWNVPSDVEFFEIDRQLAMTPVGELAGQDDENEQYICEVSCYDWYGNARPIFIESRVFALSGSELIEGQLGSGVIAEIARLRITGVPARQR